MDTESDELISVIVPAWNAEKHIRRTLQSILAQTHEHIEIIVVDDGSTDRTVEIAKDVARSDGRIQVLSQVNRGAAAARNLGAAAAKGRFLAPCDSDDLWHPQKISRQLAAMQAGGPQVGLVYCWTVGIDEDDRIVFPNWAQSTVSGDAFYGMIENNLPGSGSGALIRHAVFDSVGRYPEQLRYADEWQLHIAVAAVSRCVAVPEYLVGYRLRYGSLTSNIENTAEDLARTTRWIWQKWPDVPAEVRKRRSFVINNYLAFLFVRHRRFSAALRCRLSAWRDQPRSLLGAEPWAFFLLLLGELLGLRRYYYRFWRTPESWIAIAKCSTSASRAVH